MPTSLSRTSARTRQARHLSSLTWSRFGGFHTRVDDSLALRYIEHLLPVTHKQHNLAVLSERWIAHNPATICLASITVGSESAASHVMLQERLTVSADDVGLQAHMTIRP